MKTHRLLPPVDVRYQTLERYGRTYTAAPGSALDVPEIDAGVLEANGWIFVAESGASADRPSRPSAGQKYYDTTFGVLITFDGATWRNPNGAGA